MNGRLCSGSWSGGRLLCNVWLTVDYINCSANCFSILAIGIDRYWSVAHPFHYRTNMSKRWVVLHITLTWMLPFILYTPSIFALQQFHVVPDNTSSPGLCQVHFRHSIPWITSVTSINFWIVLLVLTVLYVKIYKVTKFFWNRRSNRSNHPTPIGRQNQSGIASRQAHSSSQLELVVETKPDATPEISQNRASHRVSHSEEFLAKRYAKRNSKDSATSKNTDNGAPTVPVITTSTQTNIAPCQKRRDSNKLNKIPVSDEPRKLTPKTKTGSMSLGVPSHDDIYTFRRHSSACPGDIPKVVPVPVGSSPSFQDTRLKIKRVSEAILRIPIQLVENMTEQKTSMRILTAIMTSFVLCWSPYSIVALVYAIDPDVINLKYVQLCYGFCYVNSLLNPIVYTCANVAFRDAFKRMLNLKEWFCIKSKYRIPAKLYTTSRV